MSPLLALSLSIAVLGGIWAYLALSPLAGFVLVWAGFIAWGSFFHSGGDAKALVKTICGNVFGIVIGWIALLIIFKAGVADMGPGAIASVVGVTVFLIVIVASIEPLSAVPANVYGYASIVAYALHQAGQAGRARHRPAGQPDRRKLREPARHPHRFDGDRRARRLSLGTARQGDDEEGISPRSGHPSPAGPTTTPRT